MHYINTLHNKIVNANDENRILHLFHKNVLEGISAVRMNCK